MSVTHTIYYLIIIQLIMKKSLSLEELKALRKPIRNTNEEHKTGMSKLDKLALFITTRVGTMGFFFIIFSWTLFWLSWNILAPQDMRFDPSPAFVLWLFISNMIQIFLMPLLLIGQNLQGKHDEIRAQSDFEVNVKAEREIETILLHLENQNEDIMSILEILKNKS